MTFNRRDHPNPTVIPEEARPPGSINAEINRFPVQRGHVFDVQGKLFFLPRIGVIVVPYQMLHNEWCCVIVNGNGVEYLVGSWNLSISEWELQRAVEVTCNVKPGPKDAGGFITIEGKEYAVISCELVGEDELGTMKEYRLYVDQVDVE